MMGRHVKWVLIGSLILNLFLLGAIGGGTYRLLRSEHAAAAAKPRGIRFAADELSEDRKLQLRDALRQTRRDAVPLITDARDGRIEVARLLAAPTLDRDALETALARTRQADLSLRARIEATVVEFASTLSPEERQKMLDALQQRGPLYGTK